MTNSISINYYAQYTDSQTFSYPYLYCYPGWSHRLLVMRCWAWLTSWHGICFTLLMHHSLFVKGIHWWTVDSPHIEVVMQIIVVFGVSLNKLLNKQSSCWLFEMTWCSCIFLWLFISEHKCPGQIIWMWTQPGFSGQPRIPWLTYCCLVMPYVDIDLGQNWLR